MAEWNAQSSSSSPRIPLLQDSPSLYPGIPLSTFSKTQNSPGGHHYEEPQSSRKRQPSPSTTENHTTINVVGYSDPNVTLPWRPFYLQRRILGLFSLNFVSILVGIEVLVLFSNRNNGIAPGLQSQHYLWTYGPTAILTLTAAAWNRVSYQTKMITPWIRLSKLKDIPTGSREASSSQALLLDYISAFEPFVIFKALRNKDFMASASATIALLIRILILLSTGLISLAPVEVTDRSHLMVAQDTFADTLNVNVTDIGNLPLYLLKALSENTLQQPDGLSLDYAFQSVHRNAPQTAQTQVTVDGLRSSLDCQPAVAALPRNLVRTHYDNSDNPNVEYNEPIDFSFTSDGCNISSVKFSGPTSLIPIWPSATTHTILARFQDTICDGPASSTPENRRIVILVTNITFTPDHSSRPDNQGYYPLKTALENSTSMLCVPSYTIRKVEAIRKDTRTLVEPSTQGSSRSSSSISAWALADAQFWVHRGRSTAVFSEKFDTPDYVRELDLDHIIQVAGATQLASMSPTSADRLFDFDFLRDLMTRYYQQMTAIIAKQSLMTPSSSNITGILTYEDNRLVVRSWAAQWMVGLTASCVILAAVVLLLVPRHGFLPRSPASILGLAALLYRSRDFIAVIRSLGAADQKSLLRHLQQYTYQLDADKESTSNSSRGHFTTIRVNANHGSDQQHQSSPQLQSKPSRPIVLHPAFRLGLAFVLVALIVAMELTLRKSMTEDGLGDVGDDTFIHYTWTSIPTLVFGILALILSSVDFQTRAITPYTALKNTMSTRAFGCSELLDMSFTRVIYREIRLGNMAALAGTIALFVSSLFTIFSASLFRPISRPMTDEVTLHAIRSFERDIWIDPVAPAQALTSSSLILGSNLSYPKFTYGELAFLEFELEPTLLPQNQSQNASSITTVLPALRGKLDCRPYSMSDIHIKPADDVDDTTDAQDTNFKNPLGVIIDQEDCKLYQGKYNDFLQPGEDGDFEYFGQASHGYLMGIKSCSQLVYYWGKYNPKSKAGIQYAAGMGCNVTFELVDVDTTFLNTNLDIDADTPPRPREDTARQAPIDSHLLIRPMLYMSLAQRATNQNLDPFFSLLTSSSFAIPNDSLGNVSMEETVRSAIKTQHGIIQGQLFHEGLTSANATNVTISAYNTTDAYQNDAQPTYLANATSPTARRRVVQDAPSTRVLEALLAVTFLFLIINWISMRNTAVLSSSPTTIASVAALIAGGNLLGLLPPGAEWMSDEQIAATFPPGIMFRLGWGSAPGVQPRDPMDSDGSINVNGNGTRSFGIYYEYSKHEG